MGANNGTKVIALIMARRRSVLARAAGDGNGNTEPTQKDEKTEDEADKVCLVNHTTGLLAALGGGRAPRKSHLAAPRRVHRRGLGGEVARPLGRHSSKHGYRCSHSIDSLIDRLKPINKLLN